MAEWSKTPKTQIQGEKVNNERITLENLVDSFKIDTSGPYGPIWIIFSAMWSCQSCLHVSINKSGRGLTCIGLFDGWEKVCSMIWCDSFLLILYGGFRWPLLPYFLLYDLTNQAITAGYDVIVYSNHNIVYRVKKWSI